MKIELKEGLMIDIKPIREEMKNLPKNITFPQFPSVTAYDYDGEEEWMQSCEILPNNICGSLLSSLALIRDLDCGIRMVSFALGIRKQK